MARKRYGNPVLRELIEREIKDLQDIHDLVKELIGSLFRRGSAHHTRFLCIPFLHY